RHQREAFPGITQRADDRGGGGQGVRDGGMVRYRGAERPSARPPDAPPRGAAQGPAEQRNAEQPAQRRAAGRISGEAGAVLRHHEGRSCKVGEGSTGKRCPRRVIGAPLSTAPALARSDETRRWSVTFAVSVDEARRSPGRGWF